jgi:hypothetical protein
LPVRRVRVCVCVCVCMRAHDAITADLQLGTERLTNEAHVKVIVQK